MASNRAKKPSNSTLHVDIHFTGDGALPWKRIFLGLLALILVIWIVNQSATNADQILALLAGILNYLTKTT